MAILANVDHQQLLCCNSDFDAGTNEHWKRLQKDADGGCQSLNSNYCCGGCGDGGWLVAGSSVSLSVSLRGWSVSLSVCLCPAVECV